MVASLSKRWNNPPAALASIFKAAEALNGLPAGLLTRVGYQESRWRDDIITGRTKSAAGAVGVMQIIPKWHPEVDPLNPSQAIPYAGKYLSALAKQFGNDWQKAVAAYNWGPGNLAKHITASTRAGTHWKVGMPKETTNYVADVFGDLMQAALTEKTV